MNAAELKAFGTPWDVVDCIEVDDPALPAADEVIVEMQAGPINPAEILLIQGKYAAKPPLPSQLGIEGVGNIIAVGSDITALKEGDQVISLDRTNWAEMCLLKQNQVIKLPSGIDIQQASMLKVNPATALKMLANYVELKPGDWVIQNAANSGVGASLISLAKARGIHTVNVVRRSDLIEPLKASGADVVVVDGEDLATRVKAAVGGGDIKLAIDAVAGEACMRLAECLADEGIVVNYGLLSGKPCMITADQTVFHGISLTGFWLAKVMRSMSMAELQALYAELAQYVIDGTLHVNVEASYPLTEIKQALEHASREGRSGKILVLQNG